ncbi:TraR/DksA family transcriptional regulator [Kordiimonas aquimaris]|uniref:TraR/DksA family transcriptional regulator n=1 Tax=Kordiimonas aquimaris TaxID=707591 RepID=UPI0021D1C696|nr:TraR/DksA C4-type zinc finger protein [Kordiimonas aquimaris]
MDDHWKTLLLALKHELEALHAGSSGARGTVELDQSRVGRLSRIDAMQGQAMNNAIAARRKQKLIAIETALRRLEEGEYGYCLKCGDDIPRKRLEQDPTAAVCLSCSS